ncbi:hypothetical protein [Reichenbachiella ulvae]|uniref:DUF4468 domain-containing protein n=1 Tax=Reichenbachiella ulvae TaxID=2980104 RepID=A0ABT3CWN9_9BACT|nr:hypothetical protein [Reichenbachiella ulvae]MCV9387968.1 hypothetical protein [Reichenbachiella ulvae]
MRTNQRIIKFALSAILFCFAIVSNVKGQSFSILGFNTSAVDEYTRFNEGYYYDYKGRKIHGSIKLIRSNFSVFGSQPTTFKVKTANKGKIKISYREAKAVIIGTDSFAVVSNIRINKAQVSHFRKDFAKVLTLGKINAYTHYCQSSDGNRSYKFNTLVLQKNQRVVSLNDKRRNREAFEALIADNPELYQKVKATKKNEWLGMVKDIVLEYNES